MAEARLMGRQGRAFPVVAPPAVEFPSQGDLLGFEFGIISKDFKNRIFQVDFLSSRLVLCVLN